MTTNSWTGAGDKYWESDANWSLGHAPDETEDVVLVGSDHILNDAAVACKTLDASAFTGRLDTSLLTIAGPGAIVLGAGGDYLSNARFEITGALTIDTGGCELGGLIVNGGTLTLLSNVEAGETWGCGFNGDINIGNFDLTAHDPSINNTNVWTWGSGKLKIDILFDGSSGNLSSPSLPPTVVLATMDLETGDIRVASIDESSFTLTRNGFTVYDANDVPIDPPGAGPTVTGVAATSGPAVGGTAVTITGTGFSAVAGVTFGGTPATSVVMVSPTSVTCVTPAHAAGAVDVVVTNGDAQTGTGVNAFTYVAAPTVTSVAASSGTTAGGVAVTISGTGFNSVSGVTFGGVAATGVSTVNSTTVTCTTPAHAVGAVNVVVTNGDTQTGTGTGAFTYTAAPIVPAGILSAPLAALRDIIAGTAAFQSFTGAADATAAAASILLPGADRGAIAPIAIIDWADLVRDRPGLGNTAFEHREGSGLGAYFRGPVDPQMSDEEAFWTFSNTMGGIIAQIEIAAGRYDRRTLAVYSIEVVTAPVRTVYEKRERAGDMFEFELAFTYSRQP